MSAARFSVSDWLDGAIATIAIVDVVFSTGPWTCGASAVFALVFTCSWIAKCRRAAAARWGRA